jgi:hypothetical protein
VIRFLSWLDRHAGVILAVILALCALLLLPGCGEARTPVTPSPAPGPFDDLANLGTTLVWVGGISAAGGIALRVLAFAYPSLGFLAGLAGFAGLGGAAVTVTGAACSYLAANPLLVLAIALACLAGLAWWYWPRIRRALERRLHQSGTMKP